jgi:hypothetical protein
VFADLQSHVCAWLLRINVDEVAKQYMILFKPLSMKIDRDFLYLTSRAVICSLRAM